jgi:exopolysaccharide biosynthesis polyprenyl glycosylphosphotransferase
MEGFSTASAQEATGQRIAPAPRRLVAERARRRAAGAHAGAFRLRVLLDLTALLVAIWLSAAAADLGGPPAEQSATQFAFVGLVLVMLAFGGIYRRRTARGLLDELRTAVIAPGLAAMIVTFVTLLVSDDRFAARQSLREWILAAACLTVVRTGIRFGEMQRLRQGKGGHPTLIVGAGRVGHLIAQRLLDRPDIGLRPVGFVDDMPVEGERNGHIPILGPNSRIEAVVAEHRVEHAILSFSASPHETTLAAARRLDELGVTVSLVPRLFEGIPDRTELDRIAGIPVISVYPTDPRGWQLSVKYAADRLIALLAIIVVSPLLLAATLLVAIDLGRPLLFRQRRLGIDGREFEMLKFRTMHGSPDRDGHANEDWVRAVLARGDHLGSTEGFAQNGNAAHNANAADNGDPAHNGHFAHDGHPAENRNGKPTGSSRASRVGPLLRTGLDELPQLFNVLRGEMSLIGPRPELPEFADRFEGVVHRYGDRHRVKSGITGWAQVHGLRGKTSLGDRVEWDNYYIENWSPWLDFKIVLMTAKQLVRSPSD